MYSRVNKKEEKTEKKSYPCLMIGRGTGVVVWFTCPTVGIVADPGSGDFSVGHESTGWRVADFKPFDGIVELSNHKL